MSQLHVKEDQQVRVLVVDDEISIVNSITDALESQGYEVEPFVDPENAYKHLPERRYDLALIDINMPLMDGEVLAREFIRQNRESEVVVITGLPDEKKIDSFLKQGFTHFIFKPFNRSQLIYAVYAAMHFQRMRKSLAAATVGAKGSELVGISSSVRRLREEISMIAKMDLPVLIMGESGTGKEIVAKEIHKFSDRVNNYFQPINCAVLGSLADSELFGHAKGSFTGSVANAVGHVGAAEGGTLFLDEVGELSFDVQAKLLRFLDNGEYMRVGESRLRHADVRVVAATNRDLEQMCREGLFREDLFYRLSGGILKTKPLSNRKEDIMPLIYHFLSQFGTMQDKTFEITPEAAERLVDNPWPGNVRQLKQTLSTISQFAIHNRILLKDVVRVIGGEQYSRHQKFKEAKQQAVEDFEREYLLRTLQLGQGNLKKALELSGMHKKNFYTKINKLGLLLKDFRQQDAEKK
ncbi:sigma-54 dependent transcriptional regulator [Desulfopila sp. IMCC35008]|uniref:sigma-54-dependent transcriptional regulator n=1 Tax=Desulfopila sp. IMCC35008 TaxID=2653858 RepID=UPI0013D5726A|nr:sigma-54 dependent transcriptional regulator [Desulfopila sp. IMCC35008]